MGMKCKEVLWHIVHSATSISIYVFLTHPFRDKPLIQYIEKIAFVLGVITIICVLLPEWTAVKPLKEILQYIFTTPSPHPTPSSSPIAPPSHSLVLNPSSKNKEQPEAAITITKSNEHPNNMNNIPTSLKNSVPTQKPPVPFTIGEEVGYNGGWINATESHNVPQESPEGTKRSRYPQLPLPPTTPSVFEFQVPPQPPKLLEIKKMEALLCYHFPSVINPHGTTINIFRNEKSNPSRFYTPSNTNEMWTQFLNTTPPSFAPHQPNARRSPPLTDNNIKRLYDDFLVTFHNQIRNFQAAGIDVGCLLHSGAGNMQNPSVCSLGLNPIEMRLPGSQQQGPSAVIRTNQAQISYPLKPQPDTLGPQIPDHRTQIETFQRYLATLAQGNAEKGPIENYQEAEKALPVPIVADISPPLMPGITAGVDQKDCLLEKQEEEKMVVVSEEKKEEIPKEEKVNIFQSLSCESDQSESLSVIVSVSGDDHAAMCLPQNAGEAAFQIITADNGTDTQEENQFATEGIELPAEDDKRELIWEDVQRPTEDEKRELIRDEEQLPTDDEMRELIFDEEQRPEGEEKRELIHEDRQLSEREEKRELIHENEQGTAEEETEEKAPSIHRVTVPEDCPAEISPLEEEDKLNDKAEEDTAKDTKDVAENAAGQPDIPADVASDKACSVIIASEEEDESVEEAVDKKKAVETKKKDEDQDPPGWISIELAEKEIDALMENIAMMRYTSLRDFQDLSISEWMLKTGMRVPSGLPITDKQALEYVVRRIDISDNKGDPKEDARLDSSDEKFPPLPPAPSSLQNMANSTDLEKKEESPLTPDPLPLEEDVLKKNEDLLTQSTPQNDSPISQEATPNSFSIARELPDSPASQEATPEPFSIARELPDTPLSSLRFIKIADNTSSSQLPSVSNSSSSPTPVDSNTSSKPVTTQTTSTKLDDVVKELEKSVERDLTSINKESSEKPRFTSASPAFGDAYLPEPTGVKLSREESPQKVTHNTLPEDSPPAEPSEPVVENNSSPVENKEKSSTSNEYAYTGKKIIIKEKENEQASHSDSAHPQPKQSVPAVEKEAPTRKETSPPGFYYPPHFHTDFPTNFPGKATNIRECIHCGKYMASDDPFKRSCCRPEIRPTFDHHRPYSSESWPKTSGINERDILPGQVIQTGSRYFIARDKE